MQSTIEDQIKEIMSELLDVEEEDIDDKFSPEKADTWDSLNNLKMITAIEDNFEITLTMDEINSMIDFERIKSVVISKMS